MHKQSILSRFAGAVALVGLGSALFTGTAHAAVTQTAKIKNWSGLCLTATDASFGAIPLMTTDCTHAHNFVFDDTHDNVYVEGHPGHCLASGLGGDMFIDQCSNGDSVFDFSATKLNPDGNYYFTMRFRNEGTFAHGNTNGDPVTMITNPGTSLAVYWITLAP